MRWQGALSPEAEHRARSEHWAVVQASQLPTDIEKPLQNMTYSKTKKWFDKAAGAGNYSINWVGESAVAKMGAGALKA
jgi:hypothetical protein